MGKGFANEEKWSLEAEMMPMKPSPHPEK